MRQIKCDYDGQKQIVKELINTILLKVLILHFSGAPARAKRA